MAQPGSWFWLKKKKVLGVFVGVGLEALGLPGGPSESLSQECVGGSRRFLIFV